MRLVISVRMVEQIGRDLGNLRCGEAAAILSVGISSGMH